MSQFEKLVKRLLSKPKNFTYDELKKLLSNVGYSEFNSGKTSGSRVCFINAGSGHTIRLHKPHPGNILKQYQLSQIIDELRVRGIL